MSSSLSASTSASSAGPSTLHSHQPLLQPGRTAIMKQAGDDNVESVPEMDPEQRARIEKGLKRKLDARCAIFVLIYIMNYLDRQTISAARLKGLQDDLRLDNTQYATCLSILYAGYILMQVPSNMVINRIQRPSLYISAAMVLWGLVSTLSGVAHDFVSMLCTRFFLGFVEAAFLPGALLLLSKLYTRRELTTRNAILYCGNLISNAFSALVGAAVLSNMQGVLGHAAWRWLFFIEGGTTMVIAIAAAFILPDLPHNTRGFTAEEKIVAQLRMTEDVGEADADSEGQGVFDGLILALTDVKVYVVMFTVTAYVLGLSFNAFFPTLTGTLGFDYVPTLLMSAPPWLFSCIISVLVSLHSDATQEKVSFKSPVVPRTLPYLSTLTRRFKFWHIVGPLILGIVGFAISMSTLNIAARYVALFLQAGSYAGYIVFTSWISSSFPRPPAKRAVAIALINAFSQVGNIAGSYVWDLKEDGYRKSYGIVLAMFCLSIGGSYVFRGMLSRLNTKLEAHERRPPGELAPAAGDSRADDTLRMKKGFRYLL
ncbi:hypothetical protein CP533_2827 [Ophiocordyceps camponoti-saundersi (nom. inval.)]|nr:hypothetical protein CP533_2827 [Ophiocordyceps camponoti-saundersi (nom. inval.)]